MSTDHNADDAQTEPRRKDEPLSMRQLQVFVTLAEEGSFTRAARRLGLSQPTVSGHMADLEARLGIRLIDRNHRAATPSEDGRALLRAAREALRGERNVRMLATQIQGLVAGTLTVGASSIPSVHIVPELLARFRGDHPDIGVRLSTGSSSSVLEQIASGELEIGVVGTQARRSSLISVPIHHDRLVLITAPDHELTRRDAVTREDVCEQCLILRPPGSGTRTTMLAALDVHDPAREFADVLQIESNEGVQAAVRAGLGVSFVSELAAREDIRGGRLATVEVERFRAEREFHLVSTETPHLSPAAVAFRELATGTVPEAR